LPLAGSPEPVSEPEGQPLETPAARKGRSTGSKNKVTKATLPKILADRELQRQESVRKIARDIQKTLLGEATMSPERIALLRLLLRLMMAYGYGTPDRMMQPEDSKKRSLVFISQGGLPWENDPMKGQEATVIAAQAQEKIEATAAQRKLQEPPETQVDDEEVGLEVVRG